MSKEITIGCKVKILDTAFGDSTHPHDVEARGKIATVDYVWEDGRVEAFDEVEVIDNESK